MRIGIDCRTILNPDHGEGAGIGHYTYQLVRHLLMIDKKNDYFLFFDRSIEKRRLDKFKKENVFIKFFPFSQYKRFLPSSYSNFLTSANLMKFKLDVFHSPALNLPLAYPGNTIVTAHDLAIYKFPELYTNRQASSLKNVIPQIVQKAKKIIAVSQTTKKDLIDLLQVDKDKIKVIYHGLDKRFLRNTSRQDIDRVKNKLNIKGEYLLFLGTLEKRKNIIRIIEAYERLREKINNGYKLVLAGSPGFGFKEIKKKTSQSKYKNDIIVTGYIMPDDVDPLFEGAKIFIFPTLYEGFGLPVIEAMADRVPVITSNISSLPETSGGNALLVDPYNVSEIYRAILEILTKPGLTQELRREGIKWVAQFDWEATARETLDAYQQAV
ncbi:MAG: glycosyltransferase family 1 protein [Patescibacteria group bacterium]|nr:glycosyltransferase family 1 protein [Patescibacteria group bacterium]MDD5121700.1 glycosyltransferase family 1 protein [Patescibacteria group bacterium]MDD5221695.1 glycosyltransferase family 1 protein [Patescibacteria group bacterium]MDD5396136.1 glycosyltransferase family 1 protein [Patescibacteria group bacterium]